MRTKRSSNQHRTYESRKALGVFSRIFYFSYLSLGVNGSCGVGLIFHSFFCTAGKRRRREGGFPGADTILRQIKDGVQKKRVGIVLSGAPVRGEHHCEARRSMILLKIFLSSSELSSSRWDWRADRYCNKWLPVANDRKEHCNGIRDHYAFESRYEARYKSEESDGEGRSCEIALCVH